MKFLIILFLACIKKNKLNLTLEDSNTFKYNGFDYRNFENITEERNRLYKIYRHFENKNLLDILQNDNVSISVKILLLKDNRIQSSNIYAGGLMNDFDFEF